ncbi:hypothetical protein ACQKWADRAFT_147406 [Trichoderma austrokoningii]
MASHDDDGIHQEQYHPSNSIPDAAYPDDSPFTLRLQSGVGYPPGPSHPMAGFTPLNSRVGHQSGYQPQHQGAWQHDDIPSSPPPPYDPSRAPGAYSYPQNDMTTAATQTTNHHDPAGGIEMMSLQIVSTVIAPTLMAPLAPEVSTSALTQASQAAEDKPDAATMERSRRERRIKIFAITVGVMGFFLTALIIGIALAALHAKFTTHSPPGHDGNLLG